MGWGASPTSPQNRVSFPGALLGMLASTSQKTLGAGTAAAPLGCFCLLLKQNKTSYKRVAEFWGPSGGSPRQ